MRSIFMLSCLVWVNVVCQAQEQPPIQIYSSNDYGGENQNWSFAQTKNKYMYVANNEGLLEFNGANWNLYPSPNSTIIRCVKFLGNLIYTGSYREFGYWEKNDLGILVYQSLSQKFDVKFYEDEEIWNIHHIEDWILFQSLNRIFIYNIKNESISSINSEGGVYKMFKTSNNIFFQDTYANLFEIRNQKPVLIIDSQVLENNLLVNIFDVDEKLLMLTETDGFFFYDGKSIKKWNIPADKELDKLKIYSTTILKDGAYLLGSISNGIIIISQKGDLIYKCNQDTGLSNNTVLAVFEDMDQNLWLGLENGINTINLSSPFKIYGNVNKNIGAVNVSTVYDDNLYLGTNQGLYFKPLNSEVEFSLVQGTEGAVWNLIVLNGVLFCGHDLGTYIVTQNTARQIFNIRGTWNIKLIPDSSNLYLQGNYSGLYVIEEVDGSYKVRNKINGFNISSRFYEILNDSTILVSHEYKGVYKVILDDYWRQATQVVKEESLKKGEKTSLVRYNGDIIYAHNTGIYKYDTKKNRFIRDSIYSQLFEKEDYTSGVLSYIKETNTLWMASSRHLSYLEATNFSDKSKVKKVPLPKYTRQDVSGFENVSYLQGNTYLYGTSDGYLTMDLDKLNKNSFKIDITAVRNNNSKNLDSLKPLDLKEHLEFENYENNFQFTYTTPEFNKYLVPEYQYKLEGIYNNWSSWTTQSTQLFENLPSGAYKFIVRARIGDDISENTEQYSFKIKRPWYTSNSAIAVYAVLFVVFSLMMHHIYKRYYKNQQRKVLISKEKELRSKELENQQQIMRFKNEKLRQDIDNKNRELGISTMSLIKKNEFLNTIKKELQSVENVRNLRNVIKIIDRNLNDKDDWHIFEEAFNNADKDFLKKIKSLHPELTSNDLRLCAYLRLNLSSKEIAPLLNISTRSVEVKRYRLRKKLNLEHEDSLTDYILEI